MDDGFSLSLTFSEAVRNMHSAMVQQFAQPWAYLFGTYACQAILAGPGGAEIARKDYPLYERLEQMAESGRVNAEALENDGDVSLSLLGEAVEQMAADFLKAREILGQQDGHWGKVAQEMRRQMIAAGDSIRRGAPVVSEDGEEAIPYDPENHLFMAGATLQPVFLPKFLAATAFLAAERMDRVVRIGKGPEDPADLENYQAVAHAVRAMAEEEFAREPDLMPDADDIFQRADAFCTVLEHVHNAAGDSGDVDLIRMSWSANSWGLAFLGAGEAYVDDPAAEKSDVIDFLSHMPHERRPIAEKMREHGAIKPVQL